MKLLCIELRRCERPSRMSPLLEVTEDTPPDMLAGSMDLRLVLPDGKRVRMSVDRRTPMMDLLVQVTTAYKISPAGNVLQPYGETGLLPYKPSTPIGALDMWIVHIVPKSQALQNPSNKINLKQLIPPFEQTLRFQVNLPRNQLYVTRVSGRCSMRDILHQACSEKNLDPSKYTLRHPKHLDKPLCDELSIAEFGHNQVTMLSAKNLPTSVSTEDIILMNKYKTQSDSGSGSAASSVSPVVPIQPSKPIRKRRPAPKPPVNQQSKHLQKQQQSETIICHSRTSSDSSGYHEASVLSESPESNNSSLPDSLPRRSKLPSGETKNNRENNKLSRSLSNLHQASTSAITNGLKPAQSISCLAPSRKKKPAPAPPVAIAEEKEERSATLPPCSRLMETPEDRVEVLKDQVSEPSPVRVPSPVNTIVPVTRQRISKPRAPVPRPRSTTFENTRPQQNVFDKLEVICSKKIAPANENAESESARLEAEIERMFDQATREHVSLESGVELSRGPSPDWNWEYRLPAPPTFRDDVTVPSLADLTPPLKQILFEPLGNTKEIINEESESELDGLKSVELNLKKLKPINENEPIQDVHIKSNNLEINIDLVDKHNEANNKKSVNNPNNNFCNGKTNNEIYEKSNKPNQKSSFEQISASNKSKISIDYSSVNKNNIHDSNEKIIQITPKIRNENSSNKIIDMKPKIVIINKKNHLEESTQTDKISKARESKADKVCINIKNEEANTTNISVVRAVADRSDAVVRVNGRIERSQEQSAILNELATVISERQHKPTKEVKLEPQPERPHSLPLDNFRITTYTSSKPVQIYKEGKTPPKPAIKENNNLVVRRNSFTEEKKGSPSVKRSASAITNFQRRLELSRSNGNLLEVEETPVRLFQRNLRKTFSELSINIDPDEQKSVVRKQETGLQSLQVLRSILPQLSQSQGALNTAGEANERKDEKPAVCLTTWGERPKRQVSLKTDRDYTVGGTKAEYTSLTSTSTTTVNASSPVSTTNTSISIEVVSPVTRLPVTPESPVDRTISRTPRTSVYKSMETGNTKAIKLPDLGRIPVVRSVELKKQPATVVENGHLHNSHAEKSLNQNPPWLAESRQLRSSNRPSYLFGCEPKVPVPPPAPVVPLMAKLKPVSQRDLIKQAVSSDPREDLLSSIRNFGKSSLKKVSTR